MIEQDPLTLSIMIAEFAVELVCLRLGSISKRRC